MPLISIFPREISNINSDLGKVMINLKACLVLLIVGLISGSLRAQDAGLIKVKDGADVTKTLSVRQKYLHPEFRTGHVWYTTGQAATARLNYNLLLGEIQFIQPTGDTLSLADEYNIKHVTIQTDTFYYAPKNGYLRVTASYHPVKLAVKQSLINLSAYKVGAYDQATAVSAIRQYSTYTDQNGQTRNLKQKGDLLLAKAETFFLIDQNNRFYVAKKAAFLIVFRNRRAEIIKYLKANAIDFNKETDLKKLLQFCSNLS